MSQSGEIVQKVQFAAVVLLEAHPAPPKLEGETNPDQFFPSPSDPPIDPCSPGILPTPSPCTASLSKTYRSSSMNLRTVSALHKCHQRRLRRQQSRLEEIIAEGCEALVAVTRDVVKAADEEADILLASLDEGLREAGDGPLKRGKRRREASNQRATRSSPPIKHLNPLSPTLSALDEFTELQSRRCSRMHAIFEVGNDDGWTSGDPAQPEGRGLGQVERPPRQLVLTLGSEGLVELMVLHEGDVEMSWIREGFREVIVRDGRFGKVSAEMSWWWE